MSARPKGYPITSLEAKITGFVAVMCLVAIMLSGPWLIPPSLYLFAVCSGITGITWVCEWIANRRHVKPPRRMADPYWPKPRRR